MLPEQRHFSELANQARGGDSAALAQLHREMDPHLERIIKRARHVREPRTELDRQLRAMARHANARARVRAASAGPGVLRRLVHGIYETLWNSSPGPARTLIAMANTTRC